MNENEIRKQHAIAKQREIRRIDSELCYIANQLALSDQFVYENFKQRVPILKEIKQTLLLEFSNAKSGCLWCIKIKPWLKQTALFKIFAGILSLLGALVQCNIMG